MIVFGLNNRFDAADVSSDATFESALPLLNLHTPILQKVARTTTAAEFTLTIDLTALAARGIGCVAIAAHNLSRTASVQIITKQGGTVKDDSGALSPWPYLPADDLHWQTHTFSYVIVDADRKADLAPTLIYWLPEPVAGNLVEITITDTSNPDGYIEIGRVFVGEAVQPVLGEEWGDLSYGLVDYSDITTTKARAKYAYRQTPLRTATVALKHLSKSEAWGAIFAAQRRAALIGEVLIANGLPTYQTIGGKQVVDSAWFNQAFLGNFTQLDALTNPYLGAYAQTIALEEISW